MTGIQAILLFVFIASSLPPTAVRADAGHDHGAPAAAGGAGINVRRIEAQSDLFELVGVVEGGAMKIFLDRYATNEPVSGAKIDIEGGPLRGTAQVNPDGTYTFMSAALAQLGQFPVTFTIAAGSDSDLLAGDLVIADPSAATARASDDPSRKRWWWIAGALLLVAGLALAWWSRSKGGKGLSQ